MWGWVGLLVVLASSVSCRAEVGGRSDVDGLKVVVVGKKQAIRRSQFFGGSCRSSSWRLRMVVQMEDARWSVVSRNESRSWVILWHAVVMVSLRGAMVFSTMRGGSGWGVGGGWVKKFWVDVVDV